MRIGVRIQSHMSHFSSQPAMQTRHGWLTGITYTESCVNRGLATVSTSPHRPTAPERGTLRWIMLAGALVGFAFLAKMLQAFLVLPALALTYLLFAPTTWGKRVGHLLVAFASMVVAGGWWVAIVALWPASRWGCSSGNFSPSRRSNR